MESDCGACTEGSPDRRLPNSTLILMKYSLSYLFGDNIIRMGKTTAEQECAHIVKPGIRLLLVRIPPKHIFIWLIFFPIPPLLLVNQSWIHKLPQPHEFFIRYCYSSKLGTHRSFFNFTCYLSFLERLENFHNAADVLVSKQFFPNRVSSWGLQPRVSNLEERVYAAWVQVSDLVLRTRFAKILAVNSQSRRV